MPRARSIASPAPKGRKTPAQGSALGHSPPENQSPEPAEQQTMPMIPLGKIAVAKRVFGENPKAIIEELNMILVA